MKLLDFPIIKLCLCVIIGIVIAYYIVVSTPTSIVVTVTSALIVLLGRFYKPFGKSYWFGISVFITFISIGVLTYNLHDQKRWNSNYSKIKTIDKATLVVKISKQLKSTLFYHKYEGQLLKIDSTNVTGKILINIKKDSSKPLIYIDDILTTFTDLNPISNPKNPYQFNYKDYLKKQYIYAQIYTSKDQLLYFKPETKSIAGYAEHFRERIITNLSKSSLAPDEISIIQALLLGQRQDISKEIYDNYAKAGVIHILAVSGLHVGIILYILQLLFKPLHRFKYGRYVAIILICILLWSFAIVAGLSPSVTRAVTMFTIVAIALNLKRFTNIYNTLAISAFVLLLCKPMFLFDVGFQLSYLAVLAIVSLQPVLFNLWRPKTIITKKAWEIFTVTTAAQLGVLPLSLFYFHQFPSLFFLSNLVVIPILGLVLSIGLGIVILSYFNISIPFLIDSYGACISYLNTFIAWVSKQESFLFTELSFGSIQIITCYLFLIILYKLYHSVTFKNLSYVLISIILIQGSFMYYSITSKKEKLIVFNKTRSSLIGVQNQSTLKLYGPNNADGLKNDYSIINYKVGSRIKQIETDTLRNIYKFKNNTILIVDSLSVYNLKSFKPDYVILRNSPKLNLNRLLDTLKPKQIIADASNYKSYVEHWKRTCRHKKIPFHSTYEKGAFIIE